MLIRAGMRKALRALTVLAQVCAITAAWTAAAPAQSPLQSPLTGVARDVAQLLKELREDSISVGQFTSPPQLAANAGPGIGKALADELKRAGVKVQLRARLGVQGSYAVVLDDKTRQLSVRIVAEVVESSGKALGTLSRTSKFPVNVPFRPEGPEIAGASQVDGAGVLASLLAVTAVLPADENLKVRQERFRQALEKPSAHLDGTRIFAAPQSPYGVEILVNGRPRQPTREEGLAFVPIRRDELYAVHLINHSDTDAAVTLTIDGLSMFAFSNTPGYAHVIVPARQVGLIQGWHRTNEKSDAFAVTTYSKSAAAQLLPGSARLGTITATFAAAWPKSTRPPADELYAKLAANRGEKLATGRGPLVKAEYKEVERHVGAVRAAVTVRYTRAE
jgi:hypothetical protein